MNGGYRVEFGVQRENESKVSELKQKRLRDPLDCNHLKPQIMCQYIRGVYSGMDDHTVG